MKRSQQTNWTPQQQSAISEQGRSIIVSAAAGSGKTAVLVERLLRILSDTEHKVRAESMVVVTFTNAAAAQMKQRLISSLTEYLDTVGQSDMDTYDWLLEQRAGLNSAKICTIHSFCFDLIREYAEYCHVSPLFTIAEPAQDDIIKSRALHQILEEWSRRTEEMELLYSRLCVRSDAELERIILSIAKFMESLPFRREWVREVMRLCKDSSVLLKEIKDSLCNDLNELITLIRNGEKTARDVVILPDEQNRYLQKLLEDEAALQEQICALQTISDAELLNEPLRTVISFRPLPRDRKAENADPDAKKVYKQFCSLYSDHYKKKLIQGYLAPLRYFAEDQEIEAKLIPLLLTITEEYIDAAAEEKRRQNILGFSDAEELALSLLGCVENGRICRTQLAAQLSEQISLIMVDEYQDSNNKQDCIFKLLSRGAAVSEDGLHYGNNAFLVGDVKQSIYSFRQANPENFRRVIAESRPLTDCRDGEMARIYLNQNFRSAHGVLEFVNSLFSVLMTEQCGEVTYDTNEQLNFGSPVYPSFTALTQIILPQPESLLPAEYDVQAECIADTIDSMLRGKVQVVEKNGSRDCKPGDFCILMRSPKGFLDGMLDAFRRRNIPVVSDRDAGLLAYEEIHLINNLLRITDNPMTDAAMAAILLSPVCGFTAEDLALLKVYGKQKRLYLQMQKILMDTDLPGLPVALRSKCQAFMELLTAMRQAAEQTALEDCIRMIYDMTDLLSLQGLYGDAERRREHLDAYRQAAQSYRENADLTSQSSLSGWLRYLDRLIAAGNDLDSMNAPEDSSSVMIKTIHKSKGLEYPFVFLAHLEHRFNTIADSSEPIQASENGLLGLHLFDRENFLKMNTVTYRYLLTGRHRRQKSEEMRLLYVALTRAKQQLFLVMQEEGIKIASAFSNIGALLEDAPALAPLLAQRAVSMQDWLYLFLYSTGEAAHYRKAAEEGISNRSALLDYCVWKKPATEPHPDPEPAEPHAVPDAELLSKMEQQLAFTYTSPCVGLVSKYSVTMLAHPEENTERRIKEPRFLKENSAGNAKKLKGSARGTAVHKIMQCLDFRSAENNLAAELDRLLRDGFITDAERDTVKPEELAAFFGSALYKRIAASDEVCREKQLFVRIGELHLPEGSALATQYRDTDGILIGTMDLLFHEKDGWVLVDYKTDHSNSEDYFLERYDLQLGLYQKAAELLLGEKVKEAYLYSFTLGKALAVDLDTIFYPD